MENNRARSGKQPSGFIRRRKALVLSLALAVSATGRTVAHESDFTALDFEEKLGRTVSPGIVFADERGEQLDVAGYADRPTILAFQYYRCTDACGLILTNLAAALSELSSVPGRDYRVLTVSINEEETPADAAEKKRLAYSVVGREYPDDAWRFLTGDLSSIRALTEAVGMEYRRTGDEFVHPLGLVILSPSGRIVRYVRGDNFLPADLQLSIMEASDDIVGPTISRFVRFCFSVDPSGRTFTFNVLKAGGTVTLAFALFVILVIARSGRKRKTGGTP